jgi:hypothetical protein
MPRHAEAELLTVEEAFKKLRVDDLKSIVKLLAEEVPPRKPELVALLTDTMLRPDKVRSVYEQLDETSKAAVQEATHDPEGLLRTERFAPKYGRDPDYGREASGYGKPARPTRLRLFFPQYYSLPTDLRTMLSAFVPQPRPFITAAMDTLPPTVEVPSYSWDSGKCREEFENVPLQVRETAADALHDLKAMLRLVDAGEVRVSDKTSRPTTATLKRIAPILHGGDFYPAENATEWEGDPAADLTMKAFAWPMLLQAAGLAQVTGNKLQLTKAGRKATTTPPHKVIRNVWEKWLKTTLMDEFHRIAAIKGQKGNLTAVARRRQAMNEVLAECPVQKWTAIDELFRMCKVVGDDLEVARDSWNLYICEQQYGSLGYEGHYDWELLQGRYALALLFEYAATLGLLDVAFIPPDGARQDFHDRWGADDMSCLSRYDGLQFVRINALGAWCLGIAEDYVPEPVATERLLKVLPNLDVVAIAPPLRPADEMLLDRFADRQSPAVWHLSQDKILAAVEEGLSVQELTDFLCAKSAEKLPATVESFLSDRRDHVGQLRDLGTARVIECADATVAQLLVNDRRLRGVCQLAGERQLVFRAADEAAVRRGLRQLGYVLPPQE